MFCYIAPTYSILREKIVMKLKALSLVVLGLAITANADTQPGGKTLFDCFNPKQAVDAPTVEINEDFSGNQTVQINARGSSTTIAIAPSTTVIVLDGTELDGQGVKVREYNDVENPSAQSTVTVSSLGLTYTCSRVLPKN
jgi:hypothetical protein